MTLWKTKTHSVPSTYSPISACDFDLSLPILLLLPGVLARLVRVAPRGRVTTCHMLAELIAAVGPVLATLNLALDVFGTVFLSVAF